jgi:site-specific recombinase XerD
MIAKAIGAYLGAVHDARSPNTAKAYRQALQAFSRVLLEHGLDLSSPPSALPEDAIAWYADALKAFAPATERLYLSAVFGFYEYLSAEWPGEPNLPACASCSSATPAGPDSVCPIPREAIEKVLGYAEGLSSAPVEGSPERRRSMRLRNLRDRAFLLTLADTGLRVHEACKMRRGDLDWNEGKAVLIGKGGQQAVIRFSARSLDALRDYLAERSALDGALPQAAGSLRSSRATTPAPRLAARRAAASSGHNHRDNIVPAWRAPSAVRRWHHHAHSSGYFVTIVLRARQPQGGPGAGPPQHHHHRPCTPTWPTTSWTGLLSRRLRRSDPSSSGEVRESRTANGCRSAPNFCPGSPGR